MDSNQLAYKVPADSSDNSEKRSGPHIVEGGSQRENRMNQIKEEVIAKASLWRRYTYNLVASEISSISRYYDRFIEWQPREDDTGLLYNLCDAPKKDVAYTHEELGKILSEDRNDSQEKGAHHQNRSFICLNGNLNYDFDAEKTLGELQRSINRYSRIGVVVYNSYFKPLYNLASTLGIRKVAKPDTFLTFKDIENIAKLTDLEVVRIRQAAYIPHNLFGLGTLINRVLPTIPLINRLSLCSLVVLRPVRATEEKPSLSIVIPARNEKGNIENALKRMPDFDGAEIEIIYVEGHSSDNTWEEIERVVEKYKDTFKLKKFRQTGKGKSDAVRLGFSHAENELLTILDADLTMPPELLERFYEAYRRGNGDFINGSRLMYPMEGEAMRPLNFLGNIFFAKTLSYVLGNHLGDSLCGTKLVRKDDYDRFIAWRNDFGDFDPFGDYELLFPASVLALGIIDIPIRYRDRTYGSTNISRFRHGLMLLKMSLIGLFRIKLGRTVSA